MAHPGLNRTDERLIPALVDRRDGRHRMFSARWSSSAATSEERYLQIAEKYNLLVTGGSDCHGFSKNKPLIGTVKLPYEYVEKMKVKVAERKTVESLNR